MASFRNLADFPKSQPIRHYPIRPLPHCGTCSPAGLASIMDLDRPWRFAPDLKRFADSPVSPGIPLCTSPGLHSFKVLPSPPWGLTPSPSRGFPPPQGSFATTAAPIIDSGATFLEFLLFDPDSQFDPCDTEVIVFLHVDYRPLLTEATRDKAPA